MKLKTIFRAIRLVALAGFITTSGAQAVSISDPGLEAAIRAALQKPTGSLSDQDLLTLTSLNANSRSITNLQGLEAAHNLTFLSLRANQLANLSFPVGLGKLSALDLGFNPLTNCIFPNELTNLNSLVIDNAQLTNLTLPATLPKLGGFVAYGNRLVTLGLPAGMSQLGFLDLSANQLTNLTLPSGLTTLSQVELYENQLRSLTVPNDMTNLVGLDVFNNQLTNVTIPPELRNLFALDLHGNQLRRFNLPAGLARLNRLDLGSNQLASVNLPEGLTNLTFLFLNDNQLTNIILPAGLLNLSFLRVDGNQLTNLTLLPDMTRLTGLFLDRNPLTAFILPESLAATNLAATVTSLRNQDIPVFTYPLTVQLTPRPPQPLGAFRFAVTGPPGNYTVLSSTNLADWSELGVSIIPLGSNVITDTTAQFSSKKFYRAVRQIAPANMVFISPNTFTMGSPTNDFDASLDEHPQTTVILTRGFWIGKYEVTQAEYLSVTGNNPTDFPGDLSRAISSVSWFDATNYCWMLTQRERAAGRISSSGQYRLPTEAEWECAARAGTSTRFSYGDDPTYASTTNYAWFLDLGHPDLIVHPVGQKLPNPWGLYDMHGNVWEWCQDNYGPLPGGVQTDPAGPVPTLVGDKVARGGAYDYPNSSCRSASRLFRFPLFPDSDVGFRVVLVNE